MARFLHFNGITKKTPEAKESILTLSAIYAERQAERTDSESYVLKNETLARFTPEPLPNKIEMRFTNTYRYRYLLWIETRGKSKWSFYLRRRTTSIGYDNLDSMYFFSFEDPAEAVMFKLQVPQDDPRGPDGRRY